MPKIKDSRNVNLEKRKKKYYENHLGAQTLIIDRAYGAKLIEARKQRWENEWSTELDPEGQYQRPRKGQKYT